MMCLVQSNPTRIVWISLALDLFCFLCKVRLMIGEKKGVSINLFESGMEKFLICQSFQRHLKAEQKGK